MMEKIKNIYGAHPIPWTLGILFFVIAVTALIFYSPSFGLEAAPIPVLTGEATAKGAAIPVGGTVTVGAGTHVGIGACVRNNLTICCGCTVGAGAAVVKDITESGVYAGVPARKLK